MTLNALEGPPRQAYQEILEEKQTKTNHDVDVLPRCRRIMDLAQTNIDIGFFHKAFMTKTM